MTPCYASFYSDSQPSYFDMKRYDNAKRARICLSDPIDAFYSMHLNGRVSRVPVIELAMLPELWRTVPVSYRLAGLIVCLTKCNCRRQAHEIQHVRLKGRLLFSLEFPSLCATQQCDGK